MRNEVSNTDAIPEFKARSADGQDVGITNLSAFSSGPGVRSMAEVVAIVILAVVIIGGTEILLNVFSRKSETRRTTIHHTADGRPVAFAE